MGPCCDPTAGALTPEALYLAVDRSVIDREGKATDKIKFYLDARAEAVMDNSRQQIAGVFYNIPRDNTGKPIVVIDGLNWPANAPLMAWLANSMLTVASAAWNMAQAIRAEFYAELLFGDNSLNPETDPTTLLLLAFIPGAGFGLASFLNPGNITGNPWDAFNYFTGPFFVG